MGQRRRDDPTLAGIDRTVNSRIPFEHPPIEGAPSIIVVEIIVNGDHRNIGWSRWTESHRPIEITKIRDNEG